MTKPFEQEVWEDSYVIPFSDEDVRKEVAGILGTGDRDITYGDVKDLKELSLIFAKLNYKWEFRAHISTDDLKYFTGLEKLTIKAFRDGIEALANCQKLTSLNLSFGENLTDLSPLAACPDLASLELDACMGISSLSPLADCPSLTDLAIIRCYRQTSDDMEAYQAHLKSHPTEACSFPSKTLDLTPLKGCRKLASLKLYGDYTLKDLAPLASCPKLAALELNASPDKTDAPITVFFMNLTALRLIGSCFLTDLVPLCPNLRSLAVPLCNARSVDLTRVAACRRLTHLQLGCEYLSDAELAPIAACRRLTSLEIKGSICLTDLTLSFPNLTDLRIHFCSLKKLVLPCPNLRHVQISSCYELEHLELPASFQDQSGLSISKCSDVMLTYLPS